MHLTADKPAALAQATQATASYTPGPWKWEGLELIPAERDPSRSAVHSILYAGGGFGFISSQPSETLAEIDADCLLIAAAPDLLMALQDLRNACCIALERTTVLRAADAAIARALGQQS